MRIYMAGVYHGGRGAAASATPHLRVTSELKYPYLLESFYYMTPTMADQIRGAGDTIFLDSGAFTMFTQGKEIDLAAYAAFIEQNDDIVHIASNLDAIGIGQEEQTYRNQKTLEGYGVDVKPVHHARDRDEWLRRYIDEGYDHIFLGGMVPENTPYLMGWLDHIWHHYLTNPDGSARFKVHGFGLTNLALMFRYPWYSVDSTSWVMASRHGMVYMDFPQPDGTVADRKIIFSARSYARRKLDSWHYEAMTKAEQRAVLRRLEELEALRPKFPEIEAELEEEMGFPQGFNPKALGESYGWRDFMNIEYFRRAMDRRVFTFRRRQEVLF